MGLLWTRALTHTCTQILNGQSHLLLMCSSYRRFVYIDAETPNRCLHSKYKKGKRRDIGGEVLGGGVGCRERGLGRGWKRERVTEERNAGERGLGGPREHKKWGFLPPAPGPQQQCDWIPLFTIKYHNDYNSAH